MLFFLCRTADCITPENRECARVIDHNIDVFTFLVDEIFDQAVDVATMFTCTQFSSTTLYILCESFSLLIICFKHLLFVVDLFMILSI